MKNGSFLFLLLAVCGGSAQVPIGFINSASHSSVNPYVVGDIFMGHQSGGLYVLVQSSLAVSIEETDETKNLVVFPNPTTNVLNIRCLDGNPIGVVHLFDLKGCEIPVVVDHGTLNLNGFQRGVYILWIEKHSPLKIIIE